MKSPGGSVDPSISSELRSLLEQLISASNNSQIGDRWRISEQAYPDPGSPVCLVLLYRSATRYDVVMALSPSGAILRPGASSL